MIKQMTSRIFTILMIAPVLLFQATLCAQASNLNSARSARQTLKEPAPGEPKFKQAKSLESAGLWEEAENLYRELNDEYPGNYVYFLPLKNMLRNQESYAELTDYIRQYLIANPADVTVRLDLAEIYMIQDSVTVWNELLDEITQSYGQEQNTMKLIINRLMSQGLMKEAGVRLNEYRTVHQNPAYYSLEMGGYYALRMAYEPAVREYLIYLDEYPDRCQLVSDRVLLFPEDESVQKILQQILADSPVRGAGVLLADLHFKQKHYTQALQTLMQANPEQKDLLNFGKDLAAVGEYQLAEQVFGTILETGTDGRILEEAILELAQVFEIRTTQSLAVLPLSGFYRGNPFFSTPYLRVDESQAESLWQAVTIYDSLVTTIQSSSASFRLGEIRFRVLEDLDGAREHYQEVIHLRKNAEEILASQLRLIDLAIAKGDLEQAEQLVRKYRKSARKANAVDALEMKMAQLLFYRADLAQLDSVLSDLINTLEPLNDHFNDVIELAGLIQFFKDDPAAFSSFSEIQLKIQQNKRSEAISDLEELSAHAVPNVSHIALYQLAYLYILQNQTEAAFETSNQIAGDSMYTELAMIQQAEIIDYLMDDPGKAVDLYLAFLEKFPMSIFYDDIRIRLRKLAS